MENELVQKLKIKDLEIKKFQDLNNVVMGLSLSLSRKKATISTYVDTITHLNNNLLSSMAQVNDSNYSRSQSQSRAKHDPIAPCV